MDRLRALQACDHCKRCKVHCNDQPRSQQCTHFGLNCIYAAPLPPPSRIKTVGRGRVLAECRGLSELPSTMSLAPATSIVRSAVAWDLNPTFLPTVYLSTLLMCIRWASPVIPESEVRTLITQMDDSAGAAPFVYAFAAVTLNLTRNQSIQQAPATRDRIPTLLTHSLAHRSPIGLDTQPTLVDVMTRVFTQVCPVGLRKLDLGFFQLRGSISLLYMLKIRLLGGYGGIGTT